LAVFIISKAFWEGSLLELAAGVEAGALGEGLGVGFGVALVVALGVDLGVALVVGVGVTFGVGSGVGDCKGVAVGVEYEGVDSVDSGTADRVSSSVSVFAAKDTKVSTFCIVFAGSV